MVVMARVRRTRRALRSVNRLWTEHDQRFELEAAERRRLESFDDWLLFGPRMR